jgi:hypothetical protein
MTTLLQVKIICRAMAQGVSLPKLAKLGSEL